MKTNAENERSGDKKGTQYHADSRRQSGLKTEGPLSEKDEVKQAENRSRKQLKWHL